jgi:hypothetical protein
MNDRVLYGLYWKELKAKAKDRALFLPVIR